MRWLPRSLFGRLVLTQIAFGLVVAVAFLVVIEATHTRFHLEASQRQGLDWARAILAQNPALREAVTAADARLPELLAQLARANPSANFYLVGRDGWVLAASLPPTQLKATTVDLAPVRALLQNHHGLPVLLRDPAQPDDLRIFSAAAVGSADHPDAYFLMVRRAPATAATYLAAHASFPLSDALALVTGVTVPALTAAVILLFLVLRPIRAIRRTIESVEREQLAQSPGPASGSREDVSELEQLSRHFDEMAGRVIELLRRLRDDDRKMREMFANVSHDLRTPLAVIQGCLETLLLKENSLSSQARQLVTAATAQTRSLTHLVETIFELSKLQSPGYRLHREVFSITELIHEVAAKFSARAERRGIALRVIGEDRHIYIHADVLLIERVLDNLIDNAIKHGQDATKIYLIMRDMPDRVEIAVSDDGKGLPPEVQEHLSRDGSLSPRYAGATEQGLGLGLSIVRRILELHGSRLELVRSGVAGTKLRFALFKSDRQQAHWRP
ncbi:MAG: sensor histidine kinase [Pseudomonadota bacterium]